MKFDYKILQKIAFILTDLKITTHILWIFFYRILIDPLVTAIHAILFYVQKNLIPDYLDVIEHTRILMWHDFLSEI